MAYKIIDLGLRPRPIISQVLYAPICIPHVSPLLENDYFYNLVLPELSCFL